MRFALVVLYTNVVLYAMAFMAQIPVAPFIVKSLSDDAIVAFAQVKTAFGVAQLIGGLISGRCVDLFGARKFLIVSMLAGLLVREQARSRFPFAAPLLPRGALVRRGLLRTL
jgi:MFS family permease